MKRILITITLLLSHVAFLQAQNEVQVKEPVISTTGQEKVNATPSKSDNINTAISSKEGLEKNAAIISQLDPLKGLDTLAIVQTKAKEAGVSAKEYLATLTAKELESLMAQRGLISKEESKEQRRQIRNKVTQGR